MEVVTEASAMEIMIDQKSNDGCANVCAIASSDTLSTVDTVDDSTSSCQEDEEEVQFELAPCDWSIVPALANVLENFCRPGGVTPFDGVRAPAITIQAYLERLQKYLKCSPECFVMALVYVDRLVQWYPDLAVTEINVHRLFSTALVVAAKMQDDFYYSNKYYATVCGISLVELNELEAKLLHMLGWNCVVHRAEYQKYMNVVIMTLREDEA